MFEFKQSNNFLFINFRAIIYITIFIGLISFLLTFLYKKEVNKQNNLQYLEDSLSKVKNLNLDSTNNAIFYENKNSNIVSINIIFKGGASLDYLSNYNGSSYLLSQSLLKGAGGLSFEDFNYLLEKYSIKISIKADRDQIIISFNTLNYYIKNAFEVLDMILNSPNLDQRAINLAKNEIFTEINLNQTNLNYKLFKKLRENLYPYSKFYGDITGTKKSLNMITPEMLKNFKNTIITKSNIYIAVSGNISSDNLFNNFNYIINKLPKGKSKIFNLDYQEPIINNKIVKVPYKSNQSNILLVFNAPIYNTSDFLYAKIINSYLGNIPDSILFDQLRNKEGLVYSVSSSLYSDYLSTFWLVSLGSSHQNADLAISKVKSILLELKNKKYLLSDVLLAKNWLLTYNLGNFSSNESIAHYINSLQFRDTNVFSALEKYKSIDKVSQANINNLLDNIDISKVLVIKSVDN